MKCRTVQSVINGSDATRAYEPSVREHLSGCGRCQRYEEGLAKLRALLLEPDRVSAPGDFNARLSERMEARSARSEWWRVVPARTLAYAASIVIAAALALSVWLDRPRLITGTQPRPESQGTGAISPAPHSKVSASPPEVRPGLAEDKAVQKTLEAAVSKPTKGRVHRIDRTPEPFVFLVRDSQRGDQILRVDSVVFGSVPILGANSGRTRTIRYDGTAF